MATANKARPAEPPDIGQAKENKTKKKTSCSITTAVIQYFLLSLLLGRVLFSGLSGGHDGGMFSCIFQEVMK